MKKLLHFLILTLIALCFNGCFWGWGWLVPYSFQPSFKEFKEICQLDPEIYQANGGKLDEEYYNKVLKYFDTSLDTIDWEYIQENLRLNRSGKYLYKFEKYYDRISFSFFIVFKNERVARDNIDYVWSHTTWDNLRASLAGNEGTGVFWSGGWEDCDYFKDRHKGLKGLSNGTYILKESIRD